MPGNLLNNGGFEANSCNHKACLVASVPSWTLSMGQKVELDISFKPHSGLYTVDLDSTGPTALSQAFTVTSAGIYSVTFFTSLNTDCQVVGGAGFVHIVGKQTKYSTQFLSTSKTWTEHTVDLHLNEGSLTFEIGSSDKSTVSCGALIDDISILLKKEDSALKPTPPTVTNAHNTPSHSLTPISPVTVKTAPSSSQVKLLKSVDSSKSLVNLKSAVSSKSAIGSISAVSSKKADSSKNEVNSKSAVGSKALLLHSQNVSNNATVGISISRAITSKVDTGAQDTETSIRGTPVTQGIFPKTQLVDNQEASPISSKVFIISSVLVSLVILLLMAGIFYWWKRRSNRKGNDTRNRIKDLSRTDQSKNEDPFKTSAIGFFDQFSSGTNFAANEGRIISTSQSTYSDTSNLHSFRFSDMIEPLDTVMVDPSPESGADLYENIATTACSADALAQFSHTVEIKNINSVEPSSNMAVNQSRRTATTTRSVFTDTSSASFRFSRLVETCRVSSSSATDPYSCK